MSNEPRAFEPVLLDLADDDYATLVNALDDYANRMEQAADDEHESTEYNQLPHSATSESDLRAQAQRARRLIDDIERQLDANSAVRRARDSS